jgi:hypothetical protein
MKGTLIGVPFAISRTFLFFTTKHRKETDCAGSGGAEPGLTSPGAGHKCREKAPLPQHKRSTEKLELENNSMHPAAGGSSLGTGGSGAAGGEPGAELQTE